MVLPSACAIETSLRTLYIVVLTDTDENLGSDPRLTTSDRNPLDDVTCYAPSTAVIQPGGAGIGVASQVLHISK